MDRRDFIKSGIGGATLSLAAILSGQTETVKPIPKRKLGKTGEMLSIIGFGGILVMDEPQPEANSAVSLAVDRGINYFDVAPTYGNAEDKLGPALKPFRKNSFLACKTGKRDKSGAREELESSLKKLETDHFDLYQLHAISSVEEVEQVFGPDGAMETFVQAKKDGLVRFLGFSAHDEAAALLAMGKFDFDTILLPINYAACLSGNFGPNAVKKAREKGMGILALKGLAHGRTPDGEDPPFKKCWYNPIPLENEELADHALRFTLSQGVTAAIPPGEPLFFPRALEIAGNFSMILPDEVKELESAAANVIPIFQTT